MKHIHHPLWKTSCEKLRYKLEECVKLNVSYVIEQDCLGTFVWQLIFDQVTDPHLVIIDNI